MTAENPTSLVTVYSDDLEFVAASSSEDAQRAWNAYMGEDHPYVPAEREWKPMPRDQPFTYYGPHGPVTKTCGEWADGHPGFYATTEI